MKKLIILLITFIIIYVIYSLLSVNKINYVSISDSIMNNYNNYLDKSKLYSFNNSFSTSSINKLSQDIKNNRTIIINNNYYYLKKILRESDILVISVGMEELSLNYNKYDMNKNIIYFNNMYSNIKSLVKEIKKYAYGKIIFIGYYNLTNYYDANIDSFFYNINNKLERLMINNNIIYIDLYELIKGNNYLKNNSFYLNNDGYIKIANIIENYFD